MSFKTSCGKKRKWDSIALAEKHLRSLEESPNYDPNFPLNVYQCRHCNFYHVGTDPRSSAKQAKELRPKLEDMKKQLREARELLSAREGELARLEEEIGLLRNEVERIPGLEERLEYTMWELAEARRPLAKKVADFLRGLLSRFHGETRC